MKDLFKKYVDNQCSPDELKEILGYFNVPENEIPLRSLIAETLENEDAEDDGDQWAPVTNEVFAVIKNQLNPAKGKLIPVFKRTWFRVAAAAILLVGGFALYNLINNKNQQPGSEQVVISNDPGETGGNKAVLTLADGSAINLETAINGKISEQGSANIFKPADGQLAYKVLTEKPTEVLFNSIVTPRGGQYQVILSDGSKVWLNAASSLRFPAAFSGKERKVALTGEAYFEVAKNAAMPFKVVVAGKTEVVVLGTHFNVNAYTDEATLNTTLLEGRVKVVGLASRNITILHPGERAILEKYGKIRVDKNADTEQAVAWKNGAFNFNNADLSVVLRQLSRWYDVDVIVNGSLPPRLFNGEIQRDLKITQVLRLLEKNNVSCRLEGKKLICNAIK